MTDHPVIEQVIAWLLTYAVHSTLLIALASLVAGRQSKHPPPHTTSQPHPRIGESCYWRRGSSAQRSVWFG